MSHRVNYLTTIIRDIPEATNLSSTIGRFLRKYNAPLFLGNMSLYFNAIYGNKSPRHYSNSRTNEWSVEIAGR